VAARSNRSFDTDVELASLRFAHPLLNRPGIRGGQLV
jgi:hypothetical protein